MKVERKLVLGAIPNTALSSKRATDKAAFFCPGALKNLKFLKNFDIINLEKREKST